MIFKRSSAFAIALGIGLLTFQNCAPTKFASNDEASDSNNVITSVVPPTICNAFGNGPPVSAKNGIIATLTYIIPPSQVIDNGLSVSSFAAGNPDVQSLPGSAVLNQFDIKTQDFADGFQLANGSSVKDLSGNILTQYFSLHSGGQIALADPGSNGVSTAGHYQFAVIADDGAIFSVTDSDGHQIVINDDGNHSNRLACASQAANLQPGKPLSFKMDYYQGPMVRISLMLFWRPVDAQNDAAVAEPLCPGTTESDPYFFTSDANDQPVATSNYLTLLSHGWQIVPAENFILPAGTTNTCTN